MLYHSPCVGGADIWGFWQIEPNQNLKNTVGDKEWWSGDYDSNLAKLHYTRFVNEGDTVYIYKKNGEEISKEQLDKTAKEIIDGIDQMLFQDIHLYEDDDLWKGIAPFEAENMTNAKAIAWLEMQIASATKA